MCEIRLVYSKSTKNLIPVHPSIHPSHSGLVRSFPHYLCPRDAGGRKPGLISIHMCLETYVCMWFDVRGRGEDVEDDEVGHTHMYLSTKTMVEERKKRLSYVTALDGMCGSKFFGSSLLFNMAVGLSR